MVLSWKLLLKEQPRGRKGTKRLKVPEVKKNNQLIWCLCGKEIKEEEMMKNAVVILGIILCALVFWLGGCAFLEQPGETVAEGNRRHLRNLRVNQQELMGDIDRVLLFDKPSKLTDKRIP